MANADILPTQPLPTNLSKNLDETFSATKCIWNICNWTEMWLKISSANTLSLCAEKQCYGLDTGQIGRGKIKSLFHIYVDKITFLLCKNTYLLNSLWSAFDLFEYHVCID